MEGSPGKEGSDSPQTKFDGLGLCMYSMVNSHMIKCPGHHLDLIHQSHQHRPVGRRSCQHRPGDMEGEQLLGASLTPPPSYHLIIQKVGEVGKNWVCSLNNKDIVHSSWSMADSLNSKR